MRGLALICAAIGVMACGFDVTYVTGEMPSNDAGGDGGALDDGLIAHWTFDEVGSPTAIDRGPSGWGGTLEHGARQIADGRIGGAYDYGGTFGESLLTSNAEFDDGLDGWQITGGGTASATFPVVDGSTVLAISDIVPGDFQTPQLEGQLTMEPETRYQWRVAGLCEQDKNIVLHFFDVNEAQSIASMDWLCRTGWTDERVYYDNGIDTRTTRVYAKLGDDTTPVYLDNATIYVEELPGPQPRMTVASGPSLAGQSAASLCAWIYFEDGLARRDDGRIISQSLGTDIEMANWELLVRDMKNLEVRLRTGTGDGLEHRTNAAMPTDTWTHVCATYSAQDEQVILYQDGVAVLVEARAGTIADDTAGVFEIGNHGHSASTRMFPGLIDEVRIYDRALDATEVMELMNASGQ